MIDILFFFYLVYKMNLIGQVVNLEKMCLICRNYNGFALFPLGIYTPLSLMIAPLNDEPTAKFDMNAVKDFLGKYKLKARPINRGLLLFKNTQPVFYIPTDKAIPNRIDQFCFPLQEKSKYDLEDFEYQKLFALRYKRYVSYLIQCSPDVSIEVDDSKYSAYTSHMEDVPSDVIYCTKELKPYIELMRDKQIRSKSIIPPSISCNLKIQAYSNELAYKDRHANRVCFPYVIFISHYIDPQLYSVDKRLYVVQVTPSVDKAYTVCEHWKSAKVNLGFSPKISLHLQKACKIYTATSDGITNRDEEFIVQYKYAKDEYSYYCFLLV